MDQYVNISSVLTLLTGPCTCAWRPSWYQGKVADAYGVTASCSPLAEV
ncbi:Uncharacterised protein [Mycobacterium tuberculosis]|nr:Uncharacterised protein [Mycobacterium tuberculosis]